MSYEIPPLPAVISFDLEASTHAAFFPALESLGFEPIADDPQFKTAVDVRVESEAEIRVLAEWLRGTLGVDDEGLTAIFSAE